MSPADTKQLPSNPCLSQFGKGAGGAGCWCPQSTKRALLAEQRGEVLSPQASRDLGTPRWGRPAPSLRPGHHCREHPAGPASVLLGGLQRPPGAQPICRGCHRPGPRRGPGAGPRSVRRAGPSRGWVGADLELAGLGARLLGSWAQEQLCPQITSSRSSVVSILREHAVRGQEKAGSESFRRGQLDTWTERCPDWG